MIWKRNASKTKIKEGLKKSKRTVREITSEMFRLPMEAKLHALLIPKIPGVGIAIASAIATVCYPEDFTVADYRAFASLKALGIKLKSSPATSFTAYFKYLEKCKEISRKYKISLRDLDRILWAKDFYDGKGGLKSFVSDLI